MAFVRGTLTSKVSMSWLKKWCRDFLSVPLYHALGNSPFGSPVPGTMKPPSFLLSGVSRGLAVRTMTSIPIALAILATCLPMEP